MFVVTVLFQILPQHIAEFRPLILKNAAASLELETGCRRFDVSFSEDKRCCLLYELYTDRAAFDAHIRTPHFQEFDSQSAPIIESKILDTFILESNQNLKDA